MWRDFRFLCSACPHPFMLLDPFLKTDPCFFTLIFLPLALAVTCFVLFALVLLMIKIPSFRMNVSGCMTGPSSLCEHEP